MTPSPATSFRIVEIAAVLDVSDDTVRRWIDRGELDAAPDDRGRLCVDGTSAARLAQERAHPAGDRAGSPARNRLVGLVTAVSCEDITARVEMLCGRQLVEAVVTAEAVRDLALAPGSLAVAVVTATDVGVERRLP